MTTSFQPLGPNLNGIACDSWLRGATIDQRPRSSSGCPPRPGRPTRALTKTYPLVRPNTAHLRWPASGFDGTASGSRTGDILTDDINERVRRMREEDARRSAAAVAAEKAARDTWQDEEDALLRIEVLCRQFVQWAKRNSVEPNRLVKGRRGWYLATTVSYSGREDMTSLKTQVVVIDNGELFNWWWNDSSPAFASARVRKKSIHHPGTGGITISDIMDGVARYVKATGHPWP